MDSDRLALHSLLAAAYPSFKLIFRAASHDVLEYPCIVYDVENLVPAYANNTPYVIGTVFEVVMMSTLPGEFGIKDMLSIQNSSHIQSYVSDGVVHDVFRIYINTL